jgi:hypothetical protein
MNKLIATGTVALIAVSFFVGQSIVRAEEGEAAKEAPKMPAWMAKTEQHAGLAKSVGEYDVAVEMYWPGGKVEKAAATAKREMILNGFYLRETFSMKTPNFTFAGTATVGYDTVRKKYVSTWLDNSSPVMDIAYGVEIDGKIVMTGKGPNQTTGMLEGKKSVIENQTPDTWKTTYYNVNAEGAEAKWMQLSYTRKKG